MIARATCVAAHRPVGRRGVAPVRVEILQRHTRAAVPAQRHGGGLAQRWGRPGRREAAVCHLVSREVLIIIILY